MNYHRCKCGKSTVMESGFPPKDCETCEDCGSTFAMRGFLHRDPVPHEWKEEWKIINGVPVKIERCERCTTTREQSVQNQKEASPSSTSGV